MFAFQHGVLACYRLPSVALSSASGFDINIVIGTHALLENRVTFKRLGLVVIDEQHRFGVEQRSEGSTQFSSTDTTAPPHMLSMTATPIPRTLAMVEVRAACARLSALRIGTNVTGRIMLRSTPLAQ
eukprot:18703-Prorocentrum_minimum.AAC.6